ncbi:integrase family protein [Methanosalsum zhilinae DSM 4017]|uniref:Integrase family protein n=1 Tax=Methanosalsum zhilinae (strain DSM 4017 / NBRC 107636 / OCM 62 / WeN5) TaxID=679901 RepID=F7XMX7_METZD|nr:tyrosine-type recombinase/integrase [Methanosalsum zhilinae]AEH59995.1 integrase family protein [Methanosalsum zhilinae DSM 4017]
MESFFVKNTKILTPSEYNILLDDINNPIQRRRFLILFWSGMRYQEFLRFHNNPEWYLRKRNTIHLPVHSTKKMKRRQIERYIYPLPDLMSEIITQFFDDPKPPSLQGWNQNLKRWGAESGIDIKGLSAKSTRKSIESWLIVAGMPLNIVYLRQGHTELTSLKHYQGLPFTDTEKQEIKKMLSFCL